MNKQNRTVSLLAMISAMVLLAICPARAGNLTINGNLTVNSNEFFGAQTRQMLNLYGSAYGIGVQDFTLYQRTAFGGGGFAWYEGGVHSNAQNNAGGGTTLMTLAANGNLMVNASGGYAVWGNNPNGGGVFGSSSNAFGVYGSSYSAFGVEGHSINDKGVYGTSAAAGPSIAGVWGENSATGGTAVMGNKTGSGGFAVWGNNPNGGGVYGSSSSAFGVYGGSASASGVEGHSGSGYGVYGQSDSGQAGYFNGNVFVSLNASVCTLTIRGGCDVAEPFQMSSKEILKGSVVVIDDKNAGQLKLSDRAYDQRVAGIVSGANGINSGIALHQDGALEGGQNVALSGRVYVLADASTGPIKPGDLLTTSDTPGHAMKVTDHAKAQGAVIGKAMSSLNEGKGMVLVLVTLQ